MQLENSVQEVQENSTPRQRPPQDPKKAAVVRSSRKRPVCESYTDSLSSWVNFAIV